MKGDAMAVVVAPVVSKAADAALATPLALTASPAELDEGFAQAIASVSVSHRSLAEQVEATASILNAATSARPPRHRRRYPRPTASRSHRLPMMRMGLTARTTTRKARARLRPPRPRHPRPTAVPTSPICSDKERHHEPDCPATDP
ncbi:PRTRC system protein E [Cupriavidus necator]|uniref:PRTRC system protein E n=1 Tax=Cupriavidus necator TaxID=106590 RepID=UPI0039C068C9